MRVDLLLPASFAALLALSGAVRAENWVPFDKPEYQLFIDMDSIRVSRGLILFSQMWKDTLPPVPKPNARYAVTWHSHYAVDCGERTLVLHANTVYDQNARRMDSFSYSTLRESWVLWKGNPGSAGERIVNQVCRLAAGNPGAVTQTPTPKQTPAPTQRTGSGFAIDREGAVVTNHHVVKGCSALEVRQASNSYPARIIAQDANADLAVLKVSAVLTTATLRDGAIQVGEAVYVAGFPLAGVLSTDMNFTNGVVASASGLRGNITQLQLTAPVQQGNSGGPLLDQSGSVVGVVVGKLDAIRVAGATGDIPQNVNFAIKVDVLRMFLDANRVNHTPASSTTKLDSVQVANKARDSTVQVICK